MVTTPKKPSEKLHKSDWARAGLFQRPRLRANDKFDPNPGGLSSTETFFNVCFCAAFGVSNVNKYLVVDQDVGYFLAYFFAWWSAWVIGSEYASRYNNVDFTHKIFWTFYGLMLANMLMHTNHGVQGPNSYGFCLSCAGIHAVVGLMTLRVALFVKEARYSALWHGGCMLLMTFLWVLAAVLPGTRWLWWGLAVVAEPVTSTLFLMGFQKYLVPITKQYQVNKFAIISIVSLGSFVAAAVGSVDPSMFDDKDKPWVEVSSFFGFVQFIMFKFLIADVDTVPIENHAISRSIEWRAAWRMLQPALILAMVAASAGLATLLEVVTTATPLYMDGTREQYGRRLAYWSTAAFFLLLVLQRKVFHLVPEHILAHKGLLKQRHIGSVIQTATALLLFIWPLVFPSSGLPLHVRDVGTLAIAATGLVVMHLILKKFELKAMTDDELQAVYTKVEAHEDADAEKGEGGEDLSDDSNKPPDNETTWEEALNIHKYDPDKPDGGKPMPPQGHRV